VLVVGRGLIGSAVRDRLLARGRPVVTVARGGAAGPDHRARDLADAAGRARLHADLRELRPRCIVLAHGPSDVSWIDDHEQQAAAVHRGVAEVAAESGLPTVLVSTDNVFSGERGGHRPADRIQPGNAYGRVKAEAERALLAVGSALVLRVSLVYGWAGPAHRSTYAERCLASALAGRPLLAPTDQVFTPIQVRDVAEVVAELCATPGFLAGVAHLAGPGELSRYQFATLAYRLAGADAGLVRPCLRRDTEWASRPRHSSLACDDFSWLPGLRRWAPMPAADGLRLMLAERPAAESEPSRPPAPAAGPAPGPAPCGAAAECRTGHGGSSTQQDQVLEGISSRPSGEEQVMTEASGQKLAAQRGATEKTVAGVMRPPATTAEQDAHLAAVAYLMRHAGATALVVLDDDGSKRPIGLITEADIVHAVADGKDVNDVRIREVMTPRPIAIRATTSIREAAESMMSGHFRHLPVVGDDAGLIGMVDIGDVCRALLDLPAG
jgi:dTDP-4-dehydrorhamnose reductase